MTIESKSVAFFPWVALAGPIVLGSSIRLLPYQVGVMPGDLPNAKQADIDLILSAYSNRPNVGVKAATLLEVDDWHTGDSDENAKARLFRARIAIGFAALAQRRLFQQFDYCGYDSFSLAVQRYHVGGNGLFSFGTRRRDGGTNHMWGADEYAFQRPSHVDSRAPCKFDQALAQVLFELPESDSALFEALREFNTANTDSPDVPEHVEIVMVKSAFEWLLHIDQNAMSFVRALESLLPAPDSAAIESGPLEEAWRTRFPNAPRPLNAWAQEFCDIRGAAAHGKDRKAPRFIWKAHTHLAFVSVLFPLLVKKQLADSGHWTMTAFDVAKLRRIDSYLMYDPFTHDRLASEDSNPWSELDMQVLFAVNAHKFYGTP
ncbi:MAG TPA: hypothetical protein VK580_10785 [Steroidobacteraceae bacterium]|nr:hypothetical protein [Steroidobacteraceae bacterium]